MKNHLKFWGFVVLALIFLITGMVYCQKTGPDYKALYLDLEIEHNIFTITRLDEIKRLKEENRELETELQSVKISYYADELFINGTEDGSIKGIKDRYRSLYLYASYAEELLITNGIEFRMVDGGLDLKALMGEE